MNALSGIYFFALELAVMWKASRHLPDPCEFLTARFAFDNEFPGMLDPHVDCVAGGQPDRQALPRFATLIIQLSIRIYLMIRIATLIIAALAVVTAGAQTKLELKVHTGRGQNGYDVNSTMISGEKDMLVIDPQFGLAEAHRLAAEIIESRKNLTTIYVTHPHPDHFFGLAVLKQAFPSAKIVALPATAAAIKNAWPARQKFWFPTYGNMIPGPDPVIPEELASPALTLEGETFPITGGLQGDGPGNSFVYIPSLKAVVAGDTVFDRVYFGVPKGKAREDWMKTLDQIAALNPAILVPGHEGPGAKHDMSAIAFMKKYIADWYANAAASKDAAEMRARVVKQYPRLGMEFTLNDRVSAFFPNTAKK